MANEQNLRPIPLNMRSKEEQKRIQSKGGSVRSPRKKYAARLRELKKKGLTNETVKKLTNIMEDPECSVLDIRLLIDTFKADLMKTGKDYDPKDMNALIANYIKLHQSHHGTKVTGKIEHEVKAAVIHYIVPEKPKDDD